MNDTVVICGLDQNIIVFFIEAVLFDQLLWDRGVLMHRRIIRLHLITARRISHLSCILLVLILILLILLFLYILLLFTFIFHIFIISYWFVEITWEWGAEGTLNLQVVLGILIFVAETYEVGFLLVPRRWLRLLIILIRRFLLQDRLIIGRLAIQLKPHITISKHTLSHTTSIVRSGSGLVRILFLFNCFIVFPQIAFNSIPCHSAIALMKMRDWLDCGHRALFWSGIAAVG